MDAGQRGGLAQPHQIQDVRWIIQYRPHIDGLRSFAIIPVVLYHAGLSWIPGGFVGVDIFFVISGYLITSIIVSDLDQGRYSLVEFYRRRILRILPLLLVVIFAVLAAGYVILFPRELKDLGETAIATAAFASNIYFWLNISYFDSSSDSIPLLHTWSLAVEEQFYIVFPILLYVLHRWARRHLLAVMIALVLASLALSILGTQVSRFATFYLLPTRAWELGAGAILAIMGTTSIRSTAAREALAWLGLVLVVAPIFYLTGASVFPGLNAVPPVAGATLLIAFGAGTTVGRILEWRPLVYVGLISYALYLWHWPVIVFDKMITGPDMGPLDIVRVLVISLALAALSRPLIETPFRRGFRAMSSWRILAGGAFALVLIAGAGLAFQRLDALQRHYPDTIVAMADYDYTLYTKTQQYRDHFRAGTCFIDDTAAADTSVDLETCLQLAPDRPNILILGDSHAAHLSGGLRAAYPQYNFLQATSAGCMPLSGVWQDQRCAALMRYVNEDFLPMRAIDGVILAGRWQGDVAGKVADYAGFLRQYVDKVMVIGPTVEYGASVPSLLARQMAWNTAPGVLSRSRVGEQVQLDRQIETALAGVDVTYRSPTARLCPKDKCIETIGDVPVQFDYGHLTLAGSTYLATGLLDGWLD